MWITYADQTQTFDIRGVRLTRMIAPSTGAREVTACYVSIDPGASSPPHWHDHDEGLIVLSGMVRATMGSEVATLQAGDSCVIPATMLHHVANIGEEPCEMVSTMLVHTRFFREDGREVALPPWTT